jgi:transcriptional regulator with XRE-family HTH domain
MRRVVGRNIKRARLARKLTQERLAEISGFSQQYISGLEKGARNPTIVTIYEFTQALKVDYLELLKPPR